jgi:urease accessory protein
MIITQVIGNLKDISQATRKIDYLELEWYETPKRILHKQTNSGKEISLKFLNQTQSLTEGDILYQDEETLVVVQVRPCESIVIRPGSMYEMAYICYEIGNKHLPLFYENDELMIPYEAPLLRVFQASGLKPLMEHRKLLHQLKTTVSPHGHAGGKSLFSKIMQLTSSNE